MDDKYFANQEVRIRPHADEGAGESGIFKSSWVYNSPAKPRLSKIEYGDGKVSEFSWKEFEFLNEELQEKWEEDNMKGYNVL